MTTILTTTQPILSGTLRYLNYRLGATDFLQTSTLRHNTTRSGRCSLRTSNLPVAGSNPAGRATENGRLAGISLGQLVVGDLTWLAIHQLSHQCGGVRKRYEQPRILESPGQSECLRAGR